MTSYLNPSTRNGGTKRIVVPDRVAAIEVEEAPFDDTQYVRVNGEWVAVDTPEIEPDLIPPKAPTGLDATGAPDASGSKVDYSLTWEAPTQNADDTPLTDFAYYVVRWRYAGSGPWQAFVAEEDSALLPGLTPSMDFEWSVLARDYSGNDSPWASDSVTGVDDTGPPPQPSAPAASSRLGTVRVEWDGLDHAAAAPPADFARLEVDASDTSGGPWTLLGSLSRRGAIIDTDVTLDSTRYYSFRAVDRAGNVSTRSDESPVVVVGVTGDDIEADSITANELAAGAVTAEKLAAEAIIGKKYASAETGARWEILGGAEARTIFAHSGLPLEAAPGGMSSTVETESGGASGYVGAIDLISPSYSGFESEVARLTMRSKGAMWLPGGEAGEILPDTIEATSALNVIRAHDSFQVQVREDPADPLSPLAASLYLNTRSESSDSSFWASADEVSLSNIEAGGTPTQLLIDAVGATLTAAWNKTIEFVGGIAKVLTTQGAGMVATGDDVTIQGGLNNDARIHLTEVAGVSIEDGTGNSVEVAAGGTTVTGALGVVGTVTADGLVVDGSSDLNGALAVGDALTGVSAAFSGALTVGGLSSLDDTDVAGTLDVTDTVTAGTSVSAPTMTANAQGFSSTIMRPVEITGGSYSPSGADTSERTDLGLAFTAPASGSVTIVVGGFVRSNSTTAAYISWRLRTGATIGSGTLLYDTATSRAFGNYSSNLVAGERSSIVSGLTPGASYNVRGVTVVANGGAFSGPQIAVRPNL